MYQSLLSANSVTISIISISIIIIITIRPHCWFCLCSLFWRVKKFLRKDERGNIFVAIFRSEEVTGDRRAGDGFGKKSCLLKKLRL